MQTASSEVPETAQTERTALPLLVTALLTEALNPKTNSVFYCILTCTTKSSLIGNALGDTQKSASTRKEVGTQSWEREEGVGEVRV